VYLASKSPQRKALLEALGLGFEIVIPDYDEIDGEGLLPAQLVEDHSRGKALSIIPHIAPMEPDRPVLGVDTMVAVDGRTVGKAPDEETAREFLKRMSGKVHVVYSGITLISLVSKTEESVSMDQYGGRLNDAQHDTAEGTSSDPHERMAELRHYEDDELYPLSGEVERLGDQDVLIDTRHASTEVQFSRLSDDEIDAYIATGEWRERAGAYAIQGKASAFVEEVRGDYSNVVGLPVPLLVEMLREVDLWPPVEWISGS
jgi:septum formation protein